MNTLGTSLVGAAFALAVVFFAAPMVAGGSMNICRDVEAHDVKTTAATITGSDSGTMYNVVNSVGQAGVTGNIERHKQAADHPHVPPVLSCTAAFWESL